MAASLQYSYACKLVLSTNSDRRNSSSSPFHARFQVSCNGGGKARLDRRNMLLGLGGLYGAANLISDPKLAYGKPVDAPNLKQCGIARDLGTADPLDVNACPPVADKIINFEFPPPQPRRIRPAAHKLSPEYIAKYEEAIRRMKALDKTDPTDPRGFTQQANIHCAYCNGSYNQGKTGANISVHFSWLFFPFHRWYLYFYERILGEMIGDPTFALPFWNWDGYDGMQMPQAFDNPNSPLYDANRDPRHRWPAVVDLTGRDLEGASDEEKKKNNVAIMYTEMRGGVSDVCDFYGQPYRAGQLPPGYTGAGTVEAGSHTGIHRWCGNPMNRYKEDLGNFYSAGRDPLFYAHHSNVDRLWDSWQCNSFGVPNYITDSDYLGAAFLFYNEKKELVRVKVSDAWNKYALGYGYERVPKPWEDDNYTPTPSTNLNLPKEVANGRPITVNKIKRIPVKRPKERGDEVLVLEKVVSDHSLSVKFDVLVSDDSPSKTDNAIFAGTFSHLPHGPHDPLMPDNDIPERPNEDLRLSLKNLLKNLKIGDDKDTLVISIVPRSNADSVRIQDIKIINRPKSDNAVLRPANDDPAL